MKNKWIWIMIALVLVAGVAWAAAPAFKKKDDSTGTTGGGVLGGLFGGGGNNSGTNAAPKLDESKVLKRGVSGEEVKALQLLLNKVQSANPLVVDGVFGSLTESKLKNLTRGTVQITLAQARALATAAGVGTGGNLWSQLYGPNSGSTSATDSTGFWGWLNGLVTQ